MRKERKRLFDSSIRKYFIGAVMIALSTSFILTPIQGITVVSAAEEYPDEHLDADLKMMNDETAEDSETTEEENDTQLDKVPEDNTVDTEKTQTTEESIEVPLEDEETTAAESPFRNVRDEIDEDGGNISDPDDGQGENVEGEDGATDPSDPVEDEEIEDPDEGTDPDEDEEPIEGEDPGESEPDPEPTPDPEPEPEVPEVPEPTPQPDPEPTPEPEIEEPVLAVDPIYPQAESISGYANPNANIVVFYPGSNRQRSASVDENGYWTVRNIAGDASYLEEGATVPMLLLYNGEEHLYENQFYVQSESGATDYYASEKEVNEGYEGTSTVEELAAEEELADETIENKTVENKETKAFTPSRNTKVPELLPETGESKNIQVLGFATLAAGLSLMVIVKNRKLKEDRS